MYTYIQSFLIMTMNFYGDKLDKACRDVHLFLDFFYFRIFFGRKDNVINCLLKPVDR